MANRRKGKGKFNPKSQRNPKASRDSASQEKGDSRVSSSMNDVAWYTHYPKLTAASASIPYPYRPGMQIPLVSAYYSDSDMYKIPGIMRIKWLPAIGVSQASTDPASLVARELYTRVRSAFSGSLDADAPDFLIYLVCLDSVFSYIGMLKRIYRAISAFNPDNYSTPDALLAALGAQQRTVRDSLMHGKVRLWQHINELVYMSRKFRCPGEFDIFNRHYWLNDHVYTDAPSVNAQMYVFYQDQFYVYEPLYTPGGVLAAGAQLKTFDWGYVGDIVDYMFDFGKSLIDRLSDWDDAYTINGYLERAFADSRYFVVDELEQNETLDLSYEPEVLTQIENLRGLRTSAKLSVVNLDISQDPLTNSVLYNPQYKVDVTDVFYTGGRAFFNPTFSVRADDPTLVDTIVASRMSIGLGRVDYSESGFCKYSILCGTEIPLSLVIFYYDRYHAELVAAKGIDQDVDLTTPLNKLLNIAAFDWHPQVYAWSGTTANSDVTALPVFDIANLTQCSRDELSNIHRVCVLSEWNAFSV